MFDRLGQLEHRLDAGIQGGETLLPVGQVVLLDLDLDLTLERLLILGRQAQGWVKSSALLAESK